MKMTKRVRQLKAKDIQDIDIIIIEEVEVDTVVINIIDDTNLLHQNQIMIALMILKHLLIDSRNGQQRTLILLVIFKH